MTDSTGYVYHIISNTHWDREWTHTFQRNRMLLVDVLTKTMDLLEENPGYKHFHLDSQTIPLEDCMAVRPDMRPRLEKHIKNGDILIGPWYTLPEMNLIDGESIVRNLLMGHRVAAEWGPVMKVGYNPMSNGQVSQLPQIYAGFGIDTILFYRGINIETAPTEFWWEAPDGSRAMAMQFPDGRGMFWSHGYLPVVYNVWGGIGETWPWKWGTPGSPVKIGDGKEFENTQRTDFYFQENIEKGLTRGREWWVRHKPAKHLILLEGHDQCPPFVHVPRVIEDFNKLFPQDEMIHANLPNAIKAVRESLPERPTVVGEMRQTNKSGVPNYCYIHPGILSTRMYLKQANRKAENDLFRWAEPAATAAWLLGEPYPKPFIDEAIKMLMANHAHDDICGCSIDKIHSDMMYRNSEIESLTDEIVNRSLRAVLSRIDMTGQGDDALFAGVFNSLPYERNEVAELVIDVPAVIAGEGITLLDADGKPVPCQVESVRDFGCHINQDAITRSLPVKRYRVQAEVSIPGVGYNVLQVKPGAASKPQGASILTGDSKLENEHLSVSIKDNGTLEVTCRKTGRTFSDLHSFEDIGDAGNAWLIHDPASNPAFDSLKAKARRRIVSNGPLAATVEIAVTMSLPAGLTPDFKGRRSETRDMEIVTRLTLRKGSRRLEFETSFDNQVECHRLRALFPSDIATEFSYAEMPFDVVKRQVALPADAEKWVDRPRPQKPQVNFCAVRDEKGGLAVLNQGLTDYEVKDEPRRTIALTLVRGIWQGGIHSTDRLPDRGFQCFGPQTCRYAVMPFAGSLEEAGVSHEALCFNVPVSFGVCGTQKGDMARRGGMLEVSSNKLVIHAIKQSEDGKGVIVRLSNPGDQTINATLSCTLPVSGAKLVSLEEKPAETLKVNDGKIAATFGPRKIVTILLTM